MTEMQMFCIDISIQIDVQILYNRPDFPFCTKTTNNSLSNILNGDADFNLCHCDTVLMHFLIIISEYFGCADTMSSHRWAEIRGVVTALKPVRAEQVRRPEWKQNWTVTHCGSLLPICLSLRPVGSIHISCFTGGDDASWWEDGIVLYYVD